MSIDLKSWLPNLNIRPLEEGNKIFDPVRKKWVVLTPEEMVRQAVVQFLVREKGYSLRLMNIEKGILYNRLGKRFDLAVHDLDGRVRILVECKSPDIRLDQSVADQASIYNQILDAGHIWITNGHHHLIFEKDPATQRMQPVDDIPEAPRPSL